MQQNSSNNIHKETHKIYSLVTDLPSFSKLWWFEFNANKF